MADPFDLRRIVDDSVVAIFVPSLFAPFRYWKEVRSSCLITSTSSVDCSRRFMTARCGAHVVCIPPRYLKTYLISIAYTAWLLGKNPKTRIVCASYAASLAEKFSGDTLRLMRSPFYRRLFPATILDPKIQNKTEIGTTVGGYRLATSVGGTATGRGAHIFIADDLLKASEAHSPTARESCIHWLTQRFYSRYDHPRRARSLLLHRGFMPRICQDT